MAILSSSVNDGSATSCRLSSRPVRRTFCLIADVQMPGVTGLDLHQRLLSAGKPIPIILITACPDDGVRARALCLRHGLAEQAL
jgi:FixJ family two-component response regulator